MLSGAFMTTAVFAHHPWTVQSLVDAIASQQIRLPDLQRPFVWPNSKVRDLIDSMYRGYPVGELMLWANRQTENTRSIGDGDQDVSLQIVDGQQRLTSLFAVMKGKEVWRDDYSRERIAVAFSPIHERFEVPTPIVRRSPEWIADITTVFNSPIASRRDFLARYRASLPDGTEVDEELVELRINRLHMLQNYVFQAVQLGESVQRATVADVFVRINSEGVNLSAADFILTWMSVFWEEGRTELENFARDIRFTPERISEITGTKVKWTPNNPLVILQPGQLLRAVVAVGLNRGRLQNAYNELRGRDPRTREVDAQAQAIALDRLKVAQEQVLRPLHWDEFLKVVERAGFRSRSMITSTNLIIYSYSIWLVGRNRFGVGIDELRNLMARWLFMSLITGRYTNSPESAIQEDLNRFEGLPEEPQAFAATLETLIAAALTDDWWTLTLPEELVSSSIRSPGYVGYLAALIVLDAEVLLSPMKVRDWMDPRRRPVKGVETHHLFPKEYLKKQLGITATRRINQVANYALVEWSTNIDISDQPPSEYWPSEVRDKALGEARLRRQSLLHALPEGWTGLEYDNFLAQRRRLMAAITREGFRLLNDSNYTPDYSSHPFAMASAQSSLTFEDLVLGGYLPPGTELLGSNGVSTLRGEVTDDGQIRIGSHSYATPNLAAQESGADVDDGWEFWSIRAGGVGEDLVTLSELREFALKSLSLENDGGIADPEL
jgi:hypothetical protein